MAFSYKLLELQIEEFMQIAQLAKTASYEAVRNLAQNNEPLTKVKLDELEMHVDTLKMKMIEMKRKISQIKYDEANQE